MYKFITNIQNQIHIAFTLKFLQSYHSNLNTLILNTLIIQSYYGNLVLKLTNSFMWLCPYYHSLYVSLYEYLYVCGYVFVPRMREKQWRYCEFFLIIKIEDTCNFTFYLHSSVDMSYIEVTCNFTFYLLSYNLQILVKQATKMRT